MNIDYHKPCKGAFLVKRTRCPSLSYWLTVTWRSNSERTPTHSDLILNNKNSFTTERILNSDPHWIDLNNNYKFKGMIIKGVFLKVNRRNGLVLELIKVRTEEWFKLFSSSNLNNEHTKLNKSMQLLGKWLIE